MPKPFAPKGAEELSTEVSTHLNEKYAHLDEETRSKLSKDIVETWRLKDEQMKASLHGSKERKKKEIAELNEKLKGGAPKKDEGSKEPEPKGLSEDEQFEISYLAGKGYSKPDLLFMKKVQRLYKEDGKTISLDDARKTSLFKAHKARKEADDKKIKAQKGASRTGSPVSKDKPQPKTEGEKAFVEDMDRAIKQFESAAPKK